MNDYVPLWAAALALVVFAAFAILMIQQRQHLIDEIRTACSETAAAAKLDLSSFVPLCQEVKR